MKIYEYNTGRPYADDGQVIRFCEIDRRRIAFADLSRRIEGVIVHTGLGAFAGDEYHIRDRMLTAYDHGIYRYPDASEHDAILALIEGEPAHV